MFASVKEVDLDRGLGAIVDVAETAGDFRSFIRMEQINHSLDPEEGVGEGIDPDPKAFHGAGLAIFIGVVEVVRGDDIEPSHDPRGEFL